MHTTRKLRRATDCTSRSTISVRTPPTASTPSPSSRAYRDLLAELHRAELTERLGPLTARTEVSVKLSAIGQALGADGEKIALDHAREICAAAEDVGATVTLDMEDHTTTDSTLGILAELRPDFPATGAVLQAGAASRTEGDCRDLATRRQPGAAVQGRVPRAGIGRVPEEAGRRPVVRALPEHPDARRRVSHARDARPAPHRDRHRPRRVPREARTSSCRCCTASARTSSAGWSEKGHTVRVYVPYGAEWYGYLMRRLAERPANLAFFGRALTTKG